MIPETEGWSSCGSARKGSVTIHCFRKGRVCRWFGVDGKQVGPDQKNVASALAWSISQGYRLD